MNRTPTRPRMRTRKGRRPRRQGMVLIIVLLIVSVTTATAAYAVHNAGLEVQSAGALRQSVRTRNVADGVSAAALARLKENGAYPCREAQAVQQSLGASFNGGNVAKYGFPTIQSNTDEIVGELVLSSLPSFAPDDSIFTGAASAYAPTGWTLIECRELDAPAGQATNVETADLRNYRIRATIFGEYAPLSDTTSTTDALRSDHESVSISRVYFEHPE